MIRYYIADCQNVAALTYSNEVHRFLFQRLLDNESFPSIHIRLRVLFAEAEFTLLVGTNDKRYTRFMLNGKCE